MLLTIEKKYENNKDNGAFAHPIVIAEIDKLKEINEALNIVGVASCEGMPTQITTKVDVKGNKTLIDMLIKRGWKKDRREKVAPTRWNNVKETYFVQFLVKELYYTKWAIYKNDYGMFAVEYIDNPYEARKKYPYINVDVLPVVVNGMGGYTSFSKDYGGKEFIKIIKILESDEPLTREERYPKNSDKFYYGWIAPNGDTYTCGFENHNSSAEAICEELFPNTYWGSAETHLEELGWIRISRPVPYSYQNLNKRTAYFTSLDRTITRQQVNLLFEMNLQDDPIVAWMIKARDKDLNHE